MRTRYFFLIILLLSLPLQFAQINKVANSDSLNFTYSKLNINNISTYVYNNGYLDCNYQEGDCGFYYPKGSSKCLLFHSGFLWATKIFGEYYLGGSNYRTGLIPGKISEYGCEEETDYALHRVYRVRRDYKTSDLSSEILDGEGTYEEIYERYNKDWMEWPVYRGAPFEDIDSNGLYDPLIDVPGYPGADQTCWYVANDNPCKPTLFLYSTKIIGMEMQFTTWAYDTDNLKNTMYRSYKLINKSNKFLDSIYISIWVDSDIGKFDDDRVGCDKNLNLGYAYNSVQEDEIYGYSIPAIGFRLEQGPIVEGLPLDKAIFNRRQIVGKKNLEMTSFYYYCKDYDPPNNIGLTVFDYEKYNHLLMQGLNPLTGEPVIDPTTNQPTKYWLSGDPITNEGWIDNNSINGEDRRFGINSGPFTMAPGDTQEIIYSINIGHGADNKQSI
ncbi:MAG: hypothetical protein JXA68_02860, partial [Ignavibacteriales bacterium]|nr:hypothetical protein [Ignavibacteriales bacterium]